MIKQGILKEVNQPTNWVSSFVAVKKPGKCIDPKDLNKALKRNHYYIKTLDDILPNLTKVFSVLDAKDGYHQIELDKESCYLTTFWSPKGRLRWLRMPFEINPASEEYQRKQEEILEGLKGVETIHDDILVLGYGYTSSRKSRRELRELIKTMSRKESQTQQEKSEISKD